MTLSLIYVDEVIKTALREDIHYLDTTTDYLIDETQTSTAVFRAKAAGTLAGLHVALRVFEVLGGQPITHVKTPIGDGQAIRPGDVIAEITASTRLLLKGERTALNLLQHLSGIATATAQYVQAVKGTGACITDTRKTLPGLRPLQKYAVVCGGGRNHRFNLSDAAMLKDNHIDAAGGILPAVKKLRQRLGHTIKIEVETRNLEEVDQAIAAGADIIMLDNMDPATMRQAVERIAGRAQTEASGGITLDTLRPAAEAGVDIISIGALTHSVKALDISMKIR